MKKFTIEFFRININGVIKTIAIRREVCNFDSIDMETDKSIKLWKKYIDNLIKDMFNINGWEYLGDAEHYVPNKNEYIIYIEYKDNDNN